MLCLEDRGKKDKMLHLIPIIRPDVVCRQKKQNKSETHNLKLKIQQVNFSHQIVQGTVS